MDGIASASSLKRSAAALLLAALPLAVSGQDQLISGPGSTLTENKCNICHEVQHIRRSPLSRGEWSDNLHNMRDRGAPLSDAEMAIVLDYLSVYYNREKPAPAPSPDTLATSADPITRLLNAHACSGCHAVDKRVVGPSFNEVARRYSGDAGAAKKLAAKIRAGGQGAWGKVPMPPNAAIAEDDLKALVSWVLQQK